MGFQLRRRQAPAAVASESPEPQQTQAGEEVRAPVLKWEYVDLDNGIISLLPAPGSPLKRNYQPKGI